MYERIVRPATQIREAADRILVNSWHDLGPTTLEALKNIVEVPVYPIGPLTRSVGSVLVSDNAVKSWLHVQPNESVIYISFRSGGTISAQQVAELASGLDLSRQRFVWVVRPPVENDASGSFLMVGNRTNDNLEHYLPVGFLTRTVKEDG